MDRLNYQHLAYFWMVAREGTIARACQLLHLTQPTISAQLALLERALGEKLFRRDGRRLVLTDAGRLAYSYADAIFSLGQEMRQALKGRTANRPLALTVGVADVLPKLIAYQLLHSALQLPEPVRLMCLEGHAEQLLADLALHRLDVVLSDAPASPGTKVRAFNHLLGECGVTFFAEARLARTLTGAFPRCLDGATFLFPTDNCTLRRSLDQWFETEQIRPVSGGEFADSALLKIFGKAGVGIFAGPTVIAQDIRQQYQVVAVGQTDAIRERFYAISVERKLKHPAIVAISEAARKQIFG